MVGRKSGVVVITVVMVVVVGGAGSDILTEQLSTSTLFGIYSEQSIYEFRIYIKP